MADVDESKVSFRWGIPILDAGDTRVPNFILATYSQIEWTDKDGNRGQGISNTEAMLVIHLASFRYESAKGQARPSLTGALRERMGYKSDQGIINVCDSLEHKNLLTVDRRLGKTSIYDFSAFSKACLAVATKTGLFEQEQPNPSTKVEDTPQQKLRTTPQQKLRRRRKDKKRKPEEEKRGIPTGADAPATNGNGHLPATFQDWLCLVNDPPEGSNEVAQLRTMYGTLYPGRDLPDFGRVGKVKKQVGGAPRLAQLLWETATRPPVGDVLSYVAATARGKRRDAGSDRSIRF